MIRRPPISTRTDTLFPYTTLFRSSGMTPLATLQAGFSGYLLQDTGDAPVRPLVRVPAAVDAGRRMHVYRHAYRERLHETLRSDYPVLLRLIGREAFAALAYKIGRAHARTPVPNAHLVCRILLVNTKKTI